MSESPKFKPFAQGRGWTLYQGDALDVLPSLAPSSVGVVITDPPYSSGGQFRSDRAMTARAKYVTSDTQHKIPSFTGDNRDQRAFLTWCSLWMLAARTSTEPGAMLCTFIDWRQLPTITDAVQVGGWIWRGIGVWDKVSSRPQRGRFSAQAEFVVWATNGPRAIKGRTSRGVHTQTAPSTSGRVHITQKTVEVCRWLLEPQQPGSTVLDPFAGSGTTGVAAILTGHEFIGIEIDPAHCDQAARRLQEAEDGAAMFTAGDIAAPPMPRLFTDIESGGGVNSPTIADPSGPSQRL